MYIVKIVKIYQQDIEIKNAKDEIEAAQKARKLVHWDDKEWEEREIGTYEVKEFPS